MKNTIALTAVLLMLFSVLLLTACGEKQEDLSDSKYVGTWECADMELEEESGELDEIWTIVVNGDGTGTTDYKGDTGEFTWKPVDGGFKTKGDIKATFKEDGEDLKTSILGVKMVFKKK